MTQPPPPPAGPPSDPKPSGSSGSQYPASYHPAYPSAPQSFPPASPPFPPQAPTQASFNPPPPGPPPGWSPTPPPSGKGRGLVVALVVAAVLVIGGGGAGIAVWANRDDGGTQSAGDRNDPVGPVETESPDGEPTTADPSTATVEPAPEPTTPTTPAETGPTDEPTEPSYGGGLDDPVEPPETDAPDPQLSSKPFSYKEYGRDWDFSLDGVNLQASFISGVDHDGCGPVENDGALTKLGCREASEWAQKSLGGKLVTTHVVLTMKSPAAADRATAADPMRITQESWRLRPVGFLANSPGVWKASSAGQFVVLTVVTYDESVPAKKGEKYLRYANGDIRGALLFRF